MLAFRVQDSVRGAALEPDNCGLGDVDHDIDDRNPNEAFADLNVCIVISICFASCRLATEESSYCFAH